MSITGLCNKSWRVDETYHSRKRQMDLFVPGGGLGRRQHRFSALGAARCGSSQAVLTKGIARIEPPNAASNQCGQESFLPGSGGSPEVRRHAAPPMSPAACAIPE